MRGSKIQKMAGIGVLSSIAYILMLLNFPLPGFPTFLKIDFSDIPALLATLLMGPAAGILVEFIKCGLDYIITGSETAIPIGQLANFIAGVMLIMPAYFIYKKMQSKLGLSVGLVSGTLIMTFVMSLLNYFVLLPAYTLLLNFPAMSTAEMKSLITAAIIPFNMIKGLIVAGVFLIIFTRLQSWIQKQSLSM
ncbi:MAG TPA: ECF transporter S component [Bacillus sp. (in: firmicutes)]|uniref:ECF transporter S component n=1 Tax=Bacillus litorisediminis TaxID=2922713 RepID=UPI001FABE770|nr:ECF transporter S component [Bacillus litorisediminis]HWO75829.1 ECF transporter S component [Bacillus sp. (in: firmicutes)]